MSKQPEALRLAEVFPYLEGGERSQWIMDAAAELRRLHEVNQELLEALKTVMGDVNHGQHMTWEQRCKQARAAINKATGDTNE